MTLSELGAEIYSRLNASQELAAVIGTGKIFGAEPEKPPKTGPYIVIGEIITDEGRLLNDHERVAYADIHLWSSYHGNKQVIDMEQAAEAAILSEPPTDALFLFDGFTVFRDLQENWMHGVLTFRVYIDRGF